MALVDIFPQVQPDEDPYYLAATLGFNCVQLEEVDLFETSKALWYSDRADFMLGFVGGWLDVKDGTEAERQELVLTVVHVARLCLPLVKEEDQAMFTTALDACEGWATDDGTTKEDVAASAAIVLARYETAYTEDDGLAEALYAAYSTAVYVDEFHNVYRGHDSTYPAAAALIRAEHPAPAGSGWEEF